MNFTLRHKINDAIIVTFFFIAAAFIAINLPFQQHRLQVSIDRIELLLQTLVERDLEQLANEIFDDRTKAIQIRIGQMRKVKGIQGIIVFDSKGHLLASDGTSFSEKNITDREAVLIKQKAQIQQLKWEGQGTLLYSKEIKYLNESLGFIRIHYSLEAVENDQRISLLISGGLLVTILIFMLVILNLILSKAILNPITYLRDATLNIVRGDLETDITVSSQDELGSLAGSFNKMRDAVKEKISDLERITNIIESTSDLVAIASNEHDLIYVNQAGKKLLGWPVNTNLGEKNIPNLHPGWALAIIREEGLPMANSNGTWQGETAIINAKGEEIPVSQVIISHKNEHGELEYLSTIIRDISRRKKAETELNYLRNYLANIIDSMPSILIGIDKDNKITQWNSQAYQITGINSDDALGKPLEVVFPRIAAENKRVQQAILNKEMILDSKRSVQVNGETRFEDLTVFPLLSEGLDGAVIRIDDVTEKVQMEEMMIQSEKMLSIGGLAAGMAHEINNPLAGMMQTAEVLTSRLTNLNLKSNQKAAEIAGVDLADVEKYAEERGITRMLNNIRLSGIRATEIVSNMLRFARKSDTTTQSHDLVEILDQSIGLANNDYDLKRRFDFRKIKIIKEYEPDLPRVPCDPVQIQQVILNILRNGAEAMQENYTKDKRKVPCFFFRLAFEQSSKMVRIEIEDNGPGMDEKTRKRILEPFFTTKPPGSGTGLGLSVSYFIVTENHQGTMNVKSELGKGSTFIVHLLAIP